MSARRFAHPLSLAILLVALCAPSAEAAHGHYLKCFPFMETWNEASGILRENLRLQLHQFQGGGLARYTFGLGFLDDKAVRHTFDPVWRPTAENETRYVTLTRTGA